MLQRYAQTLLIISGLFCPFNWAFGQEPGANNQGDASSSPSSQPTTAPTSAPTQDGHSLDDKHSTELPLIDPNSHEPLILSEAEWKRRLSEKQFYILRQKGTERAHSGTLLHNTRSGIYRCAGCGAPLFSSKTKFKSGTGWPSFYRSLRRRVKRIADRSHGMLRVEIVCARCNGHLGHVFRDGPRPTGLRHCVNSLALTFEDEASHEKSNRQKPESTDVMNQQK